MLIEKKVKEIQSKTWIITAASAVPLIFLIIANAWKAQSPLVLIQGITISFFVLGIGLIAAKISSHVYFTRNLREIESLDKNKSAFIAVASHQLKSPVASLKWTLEDLELSTQKEDWKEVKEKIHSMGESVERLGKLANDLLNITKIEASEVPFAPKAMNVSALVKSVIKDISPLAQKKGHTINYVSEMADTVHVLIDELLFYNVLQNLISNALAYGLPKSAIEIFSSIEGLFCKISVTNISEPLTQEEVGNLFQKFYRSEYAKKMRTDGSGLGLVIVKGYVERWGGEIKVLPEPSGKISFQFTIPLTNA